MAPPSQILTPRNVDIGPSHLYFGVTPPASGTLLTLNAAGVPADGTYIGGILAASTNTYKPKMVELMVEQKTALIDAVMDTEEVDVAIVAGEGAYANIAKFLLQGRGIPAGSPGGLSFGGNITVTPFSVLVVQPKRDTPNTYRYVLIYRAYTPDGWAVEITRSKYTEYKIKLKGMVDLTRSNGDYLWQTANEVTGTGAW